MGQCLPWMHLVSGVSTDTASLVTTLSPAFLLQIMKLMPREDRCPAGGLRLSCHQSWVQLLWLINKVHVISLSLGEDQNHRVPASAPDSKFLGSPLRPRDLFLTKPEVVLNSEVHGPPLERLDLYSPKEGNSKAILNCWFPPDVLDREGKCKPLQNKQLPQCTQSTQSGSVNRPRTKVQGCLGCSMGSHYPQTNISIEMSLVNMAVSQLLTPYNLQRRWAHKQFHVQRG